MSGKPIGLLEKVGKVIAHELRDGDVVSVNTWSSSSTVALAAHEVSGRDDAELVGVLDAVASGGATDLEGGLSMGYELVARNYSDDRINRVVLVSDGGANLGVTSEELIGDRAGDEDAVGIYLVGVGVGNSSTYNDFLMDRVTDLGKGASVFVADSGDAEDFFGDRFVELMDVAARNVEVAVELPGGFEVVRTTAEEVSEDRSEVPPQHLAPSTSMVSHHVLEHCDPDSLPSDAELSVTVTWQDPWTLEADQLTATATLEDLLATPASASFLKGTAVMAYAEALRAEQQGREGDHVADAVERIDAARDVLPDDAELDEMCSVQKRL